MFCHEIQSGGSCYSLKAEHKPCLKNSKGSNRLKKNKLRQESSDRLFTDKRMNSSLLLRNLSSKTVDTNDHSEKIYYVSQIKLAINLFNYMYQHFNTVTSIRRSDHKIT